MAGAEGLRSKVGELLRARVGDMTGSDPERDAPEEVQKGPQLKFEEVLGKTAAARARVAVTDLRRERAWTRLEAARVEVDRLGAVGQDALRTLAETRDIAFAAYGDVFTATTDQTPKAQLDLALGWKRMLDTLGEYGGETVSEADMKTFTDLLDNPKAAMLFLQKSSGAYPPVLEATFFGRIGAPRLLHARKLNGQPDVRVIFPGLTTSKYEPDMPQAPLVGLSGFVAVGKENIGRYIKELDLDGSQLHGSKGVERDARLVRAAKNVGLKPADIEKITNHTLRTVDVLIGMYQKDASFGQVLEQAVKAAEGTPAYGEVCRMVKAEELPDHILLGPLGSRTSVSLKDRLQRLVGW